MDRENKPEGFFYLDHRTTDMKHNIITDAFVTLEMSIILCLILTD
ncbi:putative transposase [Bacillus subtilis subsp. subtilis str. RO-NN-1]|nr:putative transposase [Bacillus subtilis subsp. subtilis str. RO-NN-1]